MAETMHNKLKELEGTADFKWDYKTMHIKCFCHKMALVVNSGLKVLGLEAPPPPKIKQSFLGSFPYPNQLETIVEEEDNEGVEPKGEVIVIDGMADKGVNDEDNDDDDYDEYDNDNAGVNGEKENIGVNGEKETELEENNSDSSNDEEVNKQSKSKKKDATNRNSSNELDELTKAVSLLSFFSIISCADSLYYAVGLCRKENHWFMCL
jgi:hypothetical protein